MPLGGGLALADILGLGAAAAPEAAAAAAPEVLAAAAPEIAAGTGAIALPEIAVTAAAPEVAAAAAPAAAGLGGAETAAALGAGSLLGITPALAGGLSPSSVVGGEFAALPGGGAGPATPISAVPGFGPGGAPLPTAAPAGARLPGSAGVGGGGAGGAQASGHDLSGGAVDPGAETADPALAGYEGATATPANPNVGGQFGMQPAVTTAAKAAGGAGSFFGNNAGLLALLGAGLGGELLAPKLANALGLTNVPQQPQLTGIANQAQGIANQQFGTGTTLEQPLVTGVLPPDQQAQIDQGLNNAIGAIKGKYASLGLSGSTMETSAIADATQNAQVIKGQIEQQMFQSGATAVSNALANMNLADSVYTQLLDAQVAQDNQLQQSIGQFASSLALGSAIGAAKTG